MTTTKKTISVRLNDDAKRQVEWAARLRRQSAGAFLGTAGTEQAHSEVLAWARAEYRAGRASASEIADQTGLAVEEVMIGSDEGDLDEALDAFLASCRAAAERSGNADFKSLSEEAVRPLRAGPRRPGNTTSRTAG